MLRSGDAIAVTEVDKNLMLDLLSYSTDACVLFSMAKDLVYACVNFNRTTDWKTLVLDTVTNIFTNS